MSKIKESIKNRWIKKFISNSKLFIDGSNAIKRNSMMMRVIGYTVDCAYKNSIKYQKRLEKWFKFTDKQIESLLSSE